MNKELVKDKQDPNYDNIAKAQWSINHFVEQLKALYNPTMHITMDKIMVPYKECYSFIPLYVH
jgi:hypothetical protein